MRSSVSGAGSEGKQITETVAISSETVNSYRLALLYLLSRLFNLWDSLLRLARLSLRFLYLTFTFGPLFALLPVFLYSEQAHLLWLNGLLRLVTFSGPTFVKLGQWASTRRDLFSADFCDILGRLHHDAVSHSWSHSRDTLRRAFGEGWECWFRIDLDHLVHSGCVGQVYRGHLDLDVLRTKPDLFPRNVPNGVDGTKKIDVAVKVLHPGILESVELDLTIMKFVANVISILPGVEWLGVPEIVVEFEQLMKNQIDLRVEAENLDTFNAFFSEDPNIKFPVPIWPLVHPEVLVETFEEGVPISYFTNPSAASDTSIHLKKHLAKLGVSAILKMVFVNNFVHADLHPGNIIVQYQPADGSSGVRQLLDAREDISLCQVQLVFLDVGIIASLEPRYLENIHKVFAAIVKNRGDIVGELFLEHSPVNRCHQPEKFKATMAKLVDDVHKMTLNLEKIQVAELLGNLFSMLIEHKVKLESNFSSVILAIVILEGLGRSLDPQLDIIREARSVVFNSAYYKTRKGHLRDP